MANTEESDNTSATVTPQGTVVITDDVYHVNNNEITGNSIVGEILTGRDNFVKWKKAMRIALSARLKLGFVEGDHPKPTDPTLKARWQRCNDVIMSWLLCSVSPDVTGQILDSTDVADAWNCLHMMYAGSNLSRKFALQQEIANLMQGTMTVAKYFEALCGLWRELDAMRERRGCSLSDECVRCQDSARESHENKVMKFLMGLNESLAQIRTHILALETLPQLNVVFDRVSSHEAERNMTKQVTSEASAMFTSNHQSSRQSFKNQQFTPQSSNPQHSSQPYQAVSRPYDPSNNTNNKPRQRPFCTHCQQPGHTKETCYKLHGYPQGQKLYKGRQTIGKTANNAAINNDDNTTSQTVHSGSSNYNHNVPHVTNPFTNEQINQILAMLKQGSTGTADTQCHMAGICGLTSSSLKQYSWIIDSGATDHFVCDEHLLFDTYQLVKECKISLPDGSSFIVLKAGKCALTPDLILHNVLLVPSFRFNLLSVGKLSRTNKCTVTFTETNCLVQDLAKTTILEIGKLKGGLYLLQAAPSLTPGLVASAVGKDASPNIWHLRMGHMPFAKLRTFLQKYVPDISTKEICKHCPPCHFAKQSKLQFPSSTHLSENIFDMIHCDIWGPFNVPTMSGCKYFLTIVDDKSRCTWTYLLKAKSEVPTLIIQFFELVTTQFGHNIKVLRSDNGGEFFNNKLSTYLKSKGCIHQSSCAYTPQQNGIVERKHRHLLDVARSLRFQSNIPKVFWGDCLLTSTYLINRTPTTLLKGMSPYEVLFGSPPSIDNLKVFGCLCYVSTSNILRDKFDPRASPCVFLGYPYGQKGYKVYCLQSHKVLVSRNVIFYEEIFPYAEQQFSDKGTIINTVKPTVAPILDFHDTLFDDHCTSSPAENPVPTDIITSPGASIPDSFQDSASSSNNFFTTSEDSSDPPATSNPIHEPVIPLRKSVRSHKPPAWQKDYVVGSSYKTSPHSINKVLSYDHCSPAHKHFLGQVTLHKEPKTYSQAIKNPLWEAAMNKEIQALEHNNTWSIAALPPHAHAIDCKWIFRIKYNSDGTIERYKARVVAKGYTQVEGIDYHDTFAPVAKMTTVRCLLAIAATKQWPVFQLDVDNAFLHGDLQEEVYMLTPPGFYSAEKQQGLVCKLHKSIYGLKQASRQWFSRFSDSLLAFGFQQSLEDYSLFTLKTDNHFIILLVYVDDVVLTGTSPSLINQIKEFIHAKFRIKDLGHLKYFLGIEVARSKEGIFINQRKYALDILAEHSFTDSKPVQTPLETKHGLSKSNSEPISDPTIYRKLVGKLIYLTITRPDLAFAVHTLSQFMATPTVDHLKATHRLLRYIKLAPAQGILFSATSNLRLTGYCDADWASCPITRRSVTGYCMLLGSSVVSWKTRKQAVVSRSSAESEYRSMASACSEIVWLTRLLNDMHIPIVRPVPLFCDSQSAIHLARNPVFHERTKHVEIDCHFVRQFVNSGTIHPTPIHTSEQPADLLTKPLAHDNLIYLSSKLGVTNFLHSPV
ncbi:unnamed protein product [Rhodiola kirilowii]